MATVETSADHVVEATVEYIGPMTERPYYNMADPSQDNAVLDYRKVRIADLRPRQHELSLDREGFAVFPHRTAVANFRDPEQIRDVYVPELEALVSEATGASRVLVQPRGALRLAESAPDFGAPGTTYPARSVHSDFTAVSGPQTARSMLPPEEADEWMARRFAIFSVWRSISPPPQDNTVALIDATSVAAEDRVLTDVAIGPPGREIVFEGSSFRYNPHHRWGYFRNLTPDETLLIKAYDSDERRAWKVPHTGFRDPSAPADATPRESLDIRAVAFFD
jgi:hypothetical protein